VRLTHSLAFKLTVYFSLVTLLVTFLSLLIGTNALNQALNEADLRESTPLANDLVDQVKEHQDLIAIYQIFLRFSKLNKRFSPYLTDKNGEILISSIDKTILKSNRIKIVKKSGDISFATDPRTNAKELPAVQSSVDTDRDLYIIIEERISKSLSTTISQVAIQSLIAFLISAVIVFLLSKVLISRLTRLNNAVKTFEHHQKIVDLHDTSSDEVSELTHSFSQMSHRINGFVSKLKERDALRRELIAGISHDLRTPLAAIKGYSELLSGKVDSSLSDTLSIILRNCSVLQKLIDGLFEIARLEEIAEKLELSQFSLAELLSDITAKFSVQAEEKNVQLTILPPSSNFIITADPSLLERAISNLVENAIIYTPSGGSVELSLEDNNGRVSILVKDDGVGISDSDLPYIFEKFFRADRSREKDKAGSGLGLAVTKKIVEAHGGEIKVISTKEHGTRFEIVLIDPIL